MTGPRRNGQYRNTWRPLDGIVLLDKPSGMSSNQALQAARRLFNAQKAGHTGSLDPLATGLLPLCFGEATKVAGLLLGACKAYSATARLGVTTDTDDADGQTLRVRPVPCVDAATLSEALASLRGRILQRPPIYSALKQGGEPLYAKARRGEPVAVAEREVHVHALQATIQAADTIALDIECGSGTYVRSLVRDIGEILGCGAHVLTLRRHWVDPFRAPQMVALEQLREQFERGGLPALDAYVLPIEQGLSDRPGVSVDPVQAHRLGHGQAVRLLPREMAGSGECPGDVVRSPPPERDLDPICGAAWSFVPALQGDHAETVVVYDASGRALGLGRLEAGVLRAQRLFRWAATS